MAIAASQPYPAGRPPQSLSAFFGVPKQIRIAAEHRKLRHSALCYLQSWPHHAIFGEDALVDHYAALAGFSQFDLVVAKVGLEQRQFTAVCVPTRIWRDHDRRRILLQLKEVASQKGTRCVLVPQRWIRATARARFAQVLSQSRKVSYSHVDATRVIDHVTSQKAVSIGECIGLLPQHSDPLGAVMAMCAKGLLHLDRSVMLDRASSVTLPKISKREEVSR